MPNMIPVDLDNIYKAWRIYLIAHSPATHFGMVFDTTKLAEFPYANLAMVSRTTSGSDLQGDESSIDLTFETEAYINNDKYITGLYAIDNASADFFNKLGFRRVGSTRPIQVGGTVTKITSRFYMANYCGRFLIDLGDL